MNLFMSEQGFQFSVLGGKNREVVYQLSKRVHHDGFYKVGGSTHFHGFLYVILFFKVGIGYYDCAARGFLNGVQQEKIILEQHGDIGKENAKGDFGKKAHGLLRVFDPIALVAFRVAFERPGEKIGGIPFGVQYEDVFSAFSNHSERLP